METEIYSPKQSKVLTFFKWILLWWPLIVLVPGILGTQRYKLILREDMISPIVGTPRTLFYLSLFCALCYAIVTLTYCLPEVKALFRRRNSQYGWLLIFSFFFSCVSVWAVGETLNGALDTSSSELHQGKVLGIYHIRDTPYVKVQDWRDPAGLVLFSGPQSFLKRYPIGSTVSLRTKTGRFGYEYISRAR